MLAINERCINSHAETLDSLNQRIAIEQSNMILINRRVVIAIKLNPRTYIGLPVGRSRKKDTSRSDSFPVEIFDTYQLIKVILTTADRNTPVRVPTKSSAIF